MTGLRTVISRIIFLFCTIVSLSSCVESSKEKATHLFERLEESIELNANSKVDSFYYKNHTTYISKHCFSKGRLIRVEHYTPDTARVKAISKFDKNGVYEKRNEIDSNGIIRTNGIVYSGKYYGPWEINYPNSVKKYRGYRYANKNFGKGLYFTEDERIDRIIHYGNEQFYDSLIEIFQY